MVNFIGPGAFGAARPAAARPTFTPDNAPGDVDDWAQDCTSPLARDGTEWRSAWLNYLIANLRSLVEQSGVPKSNLDESIIARAVQSGGMNYALATGTANAWVASPSLALAAYAAGRVLWLKAPATNTATAVTVNVSGLAARPLKKRGGADPAIGDLVANVWYPTIDDGTNIIVVTALASDIRDATSKTLINRTFVYFSTPGAWTFTIPAGVYAVIVEAFGGGGGGSFGFAGTPSGGGAGGSGGGRLKKILSVTPGDTISGTIGAGGANGTSGGSNGGAGGATTAVHAGVTMTAAGGTGALGAGAGAVSGSVQTGGNTISAGTLDVDRVGEPSQGGLLCGSSPTKAGDGGGCPGGGFGGRGGTGAGNSGAAPGGGGAGSANSSTAGAGASGSVVLEYSPAA